MMKQKNVWFWVAALLICTTIGASYATVYYYSEAEFYKKNYESLTGELKNLTMQVNLKVDYGNGTMKWYNATRVPLDATLLTASKMVLDMEFKISDFGAFVNKINGVSGDSNQFWLWSYYDSSKGVWTPGQVGSDKWVLHDGDTAAWTYSTF